MNIRKLIPLFVFILIVLTSLIYAANKNSNNEVIISNQNPIVLTDIQISACNAAHIGATCKTRLVDLNIVTPRDCCLVLGKCC
ncbi:MAG: hypothetical protein AB7V77_05080 [Candidatus Woesearchaeota archaeon]